MGSLRALCLVVFGLLFHFVVKALHVSPPKCDGVCGFKLYEESKAFGTKGLTLIPRADGKRQCNGLYKNWTSNAMDFMNSIGMTTKFNCTTVYENIKISGRLRTFTIGGDIEKISPFHNCSFRTKQFIINSGSYACES